MQNRILDFLHEHLLFEITNRLGGVSQGHYEFLNLAYHVGDAKSAVFENRRRVLSRLGLSDRLLVFMNQVHGDTVFIIDSDWLKAHAMQQEVEVVADALICNVKYVVLLVMVADCNPILIYDPKNYIVSLVHAGRKGVELQLLSKTLHLMCQKFGSNAQDLYGVIGASIRSCCYEVQQDVADIFQTKYFPMNTILQFQKKLFLDLISPLKQEWIQAGAKLDSLWIDSTCTACSDEYYSFRRERQCGRFGIVAGLK